MVSPNKANFNLREKDPLPRNILHSHEVNHGKTGQRASLKVFVVPTDYQGWLSEATSLKVSPENLSYSGDARDSAKSGLGYTGNRHLNYLVESISVNVGGLLAEVSSLPRKQASVGAVIVVRGWKSQPQGEGPQSVGISRAK